VQVLLADRTAVRSMIGYTIGAILPSVCLPSVRPSISDELYFGAQDRRMVVFMGEACGLPIYQPLLL